MKNAIARFIYIFIFSLSPLVCAQDQSDHPLLGRMSGFEVSDKEVKKFDALELKDYQVKGTVKGWKFPWRLEGKITTIKYLDKSQSKSNFQIYSNYENALKKIGALQLNSDFERTSDDVRLSNHVFELPAKQAGKPVYILLYINSPQWYSLTYIEPEQMAQEVVGGKLAEEIKAKGFATMYINFDANKSGLKADGVTAVKQITELLKSDPTLKLAIKGHTDNVGAAAANKKLSQGRATSVMNAVVASGIEAKRLSAIGMGAEAPVADNQTEAGRAKNRRVELLKVN